MADNLNLMPYDQTPWKERLTI